MCVQSVVVAKGQQCAIEKAQILHVCLIVLLVAVLTCGPWFPLVECRRDDSSLEGCVVLCHWDQIPDQQLEGSVCFDSWCERGHKPDGGRGGGTAGVTHL